MSQQHVFVAARSTVVHKDLRHVSQFPPKSFCAHLSKITFSTIAALSSVMCVSCLNGDTNTTHEVGHLEVVTHNIHPAPLPPAVFLTEYQP